MSTSPEVRIQTHYCQWLTQPSSLWNLEGTQFLHKAELLSWLPHLWGPFLTQRTLKTVIVSHQICTRVQFFLTTFLSRDESYLPLLSFSLGIWNLSNVPIQELFLSPCKCQSGLIFFPQQIPVTPSRTISKSSCDLSLALGCSPGPSGTWHHTKVTFVSVVCD